MRHFKLLLIPLFWLLSGLPLQSAIRQNLDADWKFAFGHHDPALDFGCGTEYFNYLTKANSVHNTGPYAKEFSDSGWIAVDLPFDFVVDLPYDSLASHSHGYKTVGFRYPATSVGWYRKVLPIGADDSANRLALVFDGIFRDSRVWINGFYLGGEPSGYARQIYDITPYVNFGGDNVIAVRADATFEEGWFYEGGGIYRHVWLEKRPRVHIVPGSVSMAYEPGRVDVGFEVANRRHGDDAPFSGTVDVAIIDSDGREVESVTSPVADILPGGEKPFRVTLSPGALKEWHPDTPHLYTLRLMLHDGADIDTVSHTTGFRRVEWSADSGMILNGRRFQLKGVNMHQDHAGVGAGIPDAVNVYRLKELKKYGVNAYRASHNPMTPEVLDACDSLGILVVEENRLLGINDYHLGQLRTMIRRDRLHPSVILWSVGNEEWGVEWSDHGERIVRELRDLSHRLDPTRAMTVATSGGPTPVIPSDVAGYNYVVQNPIDKYRVDYPGRVGFGSEETSGCGTRGIYFPQPDGTRMPAHNRTPEVARDSCINRISRGMKFYAERPWLAGLFFWTGFDYRGEPNPLKYPTSLSEFGLLDYCGFPKDEAYYVKSAWTDEPVLHILPHWNHPGREGEMIDVWAYTNVDEVELRLNGRSLGRRKVTPLEHVAWSVPYKPGRLEARGYRKGRQVISERVETTGLPAAVVPTVAWEQDGIQIINVDVVDSRGRVVPDASPRLTFNIPDGAVMLGAGNGDPACHIPERPRPGTAPASFSYPAFNGYAQFILRNPEGSPWSIELQR